MRKLILSAVLLALAGVVTGAARSTTPVVDLTGTWAFIVDLEAGGHGEPTFVFKQEKEVLTGSYDGPLGKHQVTGTVKDNKAVFGFDFPIEDVKHKATYTGTIEDATKMSGTMEISEGPKGKWTATRK